jgi:hypothetical protein
MMREGVHPEARRPPFTPGWDVVGVVDALGEGVGPMPLGATVATLPIVGGYAEYLCLRATELVPVPPPLDLAEAVCLILNYVTAARCFTARRRPGRARRRWSMAPPAASARPCSSWPGCTAGYTGANPAHGKFVKAPAVPRDGKTVCLSPHDCRRLLEAPQVKDRKGELIPAGVRDRAMLAVFAYSGCRVGELVRLRVRDYKTKVNIGF